MLRRKGFTLIELLVVIAIISLLIAILVPSLKKAKLAAEEVICRSNLRQYGLAGEMYLQDNGSTFPNAWDSIFKSKAESGRPRACQWHDVQRDPSHRAELRGTLWSYISGGGKVHYCRTFARLARTGQPHKDHDSSIEIEPLFCYSMNAFLGGFENDHTLRVKSSQVRSPAGTFFFAEENGWPYMDPDRPYRYMRYKDTLNDNALCGAPRHPKDSQAWNLPRTQPPPFLDCFGSFHQTTGSRYNDGMANAVLVDGHVELVDPQDTYSYANWK